MATPWIAAAVIVVLAVVVLSYRQTVGVYPDGGGDYRVVSDNIGPRAGAVTGAALLLDYVLTVAVSASAAATNLGSAIPILREFRVPIALAIVLFVVIINLRGTSPTSLAFAVPVYLFVGSIFLMVAVAAVRLALGLEVLAPSADREIIAEAQFTGLALVLLVARAFPLVRRR